MGGSRIVDRVAAALREVTPDLLLVANHDDAARWLQGVPVIADAIPGAGGLSGVHAALTYARRAALVVAWDMPFVSPALLRELWRRGAEARAEACYVESASPVRMEPFCAYYALECLPALDRAVRAGGFGGARFARSLAHVAWIARAESAAFGDPDRMLVSVNSADDLARAEAISAGAI